jgi:hypothetical protein
MSDLSPLSGVKRKLDFGAVRSAFDPSGHPFVGRANNTLSAQAEVVPEHDPVRAATERPSPDLVRYRGVSGVALRTGG